MSSLYKFILGVFLFLSIPSFVFAADITLFYSESCPNCSREEAWLAKLDLDVEYRNVGNKENIDLLKDLYIEYEVPQDMWGLVPMTFVGDQYFLGFDSANGTGAQILRALEGDNQEQVIRVPIIGEIDPSKYSLVGLTVLMGGLDGFNVCSLGAVIFVLSLALSLNSRKKTLIYGGLFVLVTALVYGLLIGLWYQLFNVLGQYLKWMEALVGLISVGGGVHFFKEFIRMKKHGVTCEHDKGSTGLKKRLEESIKGSWKPLAVVGTLLLFGVVITIIEFPCSAAVPVVYAGILANKDLSTMTHLFYISLFVLFYLIDELIVFGVAVSKMTIWLQSPRFVIWVTLTQSVVMTLLGLYYLL